jgi:hypothetical protein
MACLPLPFPPHFVRVSVPARPTQSAETGAIQISAHGKRVVLSSPCLEARCNHMSSTCVADRVLLEGNVNVTFHMPGRPARIVAQRVILGLSDGYYEVNPRSEDGVPGMPVSYFPMLPPPPLPFEAMTFGMPLPPPPPPPDFRFPPLPWSPTYHGN